MKKYIIFYVFIFLLSSPTHAVDSISEKNCLENQIAECVNAGKEYSKKGNYTEAIKFYKLACDKNDLLGCTGLGAIEYRRGNKDIAKKIFQKNCENSEKKSCDFFKNITKEEQLNNKITQLPNNKTRELLIAMKMDSQLSKVGDQIYETSLLTFKQKSHVDMPEEMRKIIKQSIEEEPIADKLLDLIIPYYEQTFTPEELDTLTTFYKTQVGQKFIDETPKLAQILTSLTQKWSEKVILTIDKKFKDIQSNQKPIKK